MSIQQPLLITDRPHVEPEPKRTPWFEEPDVKAMIDAIDDPKILRELNALKLVKSKAFVFDVLIPLLEAKDTKLIVLETDERGPGALRHSRQGLVLKFFKRLQQQDDILVIERNARTKAYLLQLLVEICNVPGSQRIVERVTATRFVFHMMCSQEVKTITVVANSRDAVAMSGFMAQTCYIVNHVEIK